MNENEPYQSKAMLRYLLNKDPEAQSRIAGMDAVSEKERLFLMVSCSAQIIVYTIAQMSGLDKEAAKTGLSSLIDVMEQQIEEICQ